MLATFGLERLESSLGLGDGHPAQPPGLRAQTTQAPRPSDAPQAVFVPARMPPRPLPHRGHAVFNGMAALLDEPGLPTRVCRREPANPQFQPTPQANTV
jgi:hypothetical protein